MNEQETIDGIKGEWRTVTRPEEVTAGQRVRYGDGPEKFGYTNSRFAENKVRIVSGFSSSGMALNQLNGAVFYWDGGTQAFFPLPVKPVKRKVAKVVISRLMIDGFWFHIDLNCVRCQMTWFVKSRSSAIRGAKRFCKAIGYEMELQK